MRSLGLLRPLAALRMSEGERRQTRKGMSGAATRIPEPQLVTFRPRGQGFVYPSQGCTAPDFTNQSLGSWESTHLKVKPTCGSFAIPGLCVGGNHVANPLGKSQHTTARNTCPDKRCSLQGPMSTQEIPSQESAPNIADSPKRAYP